MSGDEAYSESAAAPTEGAVLRSRRVDTSIVVEHKDSGFDRGTVVEAIRASLLSERLEASSRGPFGHTSQTLALLESLVEAADVGLAAAEELRGAVLEELSGEASFSLPTLGPEHRQLIASFAVVVMADILSRNAESFCQRPSVEGGLELDGLRDLLQDDSTLESLLQRLFRLARAYGDHAPSVEPGDDNTPPQVGTVVESVVAFFQLLRNSVLELARTSSMRPLVKALEKFTVSVAGYSYDALLIESRRHEPSGLLPVTTADIVGNEAFLDAGLRLARDVAGYDFESRTNPKRFSPILFGLGRPGCGKTVTAHAIGNYFLDFCRERNVPARFHVVRRTDWASSYQNASAQNLVRFFREQVYGAEGVSGVYWPDIDTAFASRDSTQLRQEEKQNLGAVFGVFDGTLLPRDGKWFLICDANNLHMDSATISRIAQNPFRVEGPQGADEYVRLMRDVLLRDVARFLPDGEEVWRRLGELSRSLALSGRNIDAACGNIRAHIQDFDYPDEYFRATTDERAEIVEGLGHSVDEQYIESALRSLATFRDDAQVEAETKRFESEVSNIVRHLNASRAAQSILSQSSGDSSSSGSEAL